MVTHDRVTDARRCVTKTGSAPRWALIFTHVKNVRARDAFLKMKPSVMGLLFCLITDYIGTLSRRTLSVREAEALLQVVPGFTLAHSVVRGRALLFHHLVTPAEVGAVQALGQKVPELCEVFLGTRQTHGVVGATARRRHVCPRRAERTQQRAARIRVFILEAGIFGHDGVSGHHEQKHGQQGQLGAHDHKAERHLISREAFNQCFL